LRRRSEKCVAEGSRYVHRIGLYLSFHLRRVLDPFVHGTFQNLKTSEDTFGHDITPLMAYGLIKQRFPGTGYPGRNGGKRVQNTMGGIRITSLLTTEE